MGIHTQPSNTFAEINALLDVYEDAAEFYDTQNGIIMGDFNADCRYLSQSRYNELILVTDERFTWLIGSDTTTGATDCAYDRYNTVILLA